MVRTYSLVVLGASVVIWHFFLHSSPDTVLLKGHQEDLSRCYCNCDLSLSPVPYHIEVEILLHPGSGFVKLLNHFHDVEGVQGVHYGGSLYAPCTRHKLKDQIGGTRLSTFPARPFYKLKPLAEEYSNIREGRCNFNPSEVHSSGVQLVSGRDISLAALIGERRRRQLARGKGL